MIIVTIWRQCLQRLKSTNSPAAQAVRLCSGLAVSERCSQIRDEPVQIFADQFLIQKQVQWSIYAEIRGPEPPQRLPTHAEQKFHQQWCDGEMPETVLPNGAGSSDQLHMPGQGRSTCASHSIWYYRAQARLDISVASSVQAAISLIVTLGATGCGLRCMSEGTKVWSWHLCAADVEARIESDLQMTEDPADFLQNLQSGTYVGTMCSMLLMLLQ